MDLFGLIHAPNPTKVRTGSRPRAPHEHPLLTLTASRVIEMDEPAVAMDSSGVPSAIEKSPLDFADEAEASGRETAALEANTCRICNAGLLKVLLLLRNRGLKMLLLPLKFCLPGVCTGLSGVLLMLRLRFEQEAKLLKKSVAQVARREKRNQDRELE
nr:hypothetical protein [Tanacetum cinerariifolium]